MARMTEATQEQIDTYNDGSHVYELCGFVRVSGKECPVERCGHDRDNPQFEVMAPQGFHFDADETHTLLCFSKADIHERTRMNDLIPCHAGCDA